MTATPEPTPSLCPRCRSTTVELRSTSPIAGIWTVYACGTCLYTWRSTEPEENRDPDKYPAVFRIDPGTLAGLAVVPAIPPPRTAGPNAPSDK